MNQAPIKTKYLKLRNKTYRKYKKIGKILCPYLQRNIVFIDGWKIKVIVKQIGKSKPLFWSVIPNWVTNKKRDKGKKYVNYTGSLEGD